jgi:Domain of unknown function (DUF4062)/MalT-like TPR region
MVIRTPDQRLRVFVSSTLSELAQERRAVARAISTLRLTPVMFELGARPHPPQELYRAYLEQSHVFIGLYWQRYGWIGPGMDISGLQDEFELSASLPRLLYVREPAPGREPGLAGLLDRIIAEGSVSYRTFRTPGELGRLVRDDLATLLSERFAVASTSEHAGCYRALAEQADRPLRGAGHGEWLEQMEAEAGNVAAAVRWYLAHDPGPLPHLLRVLWSFWFLRDHEGRSWVAQLLPAAGSLDPQARAELVWAALIAAIETGDDAAALAARNRLTPLLPGIEDPFLRAICQLAVAWTSPITGDFDGGLREASDSLTQLRGLDEPFWMALAVGSLGGVETVLGRYHDALRHLREASDLADRLGSARLAAWSRVQQGTLDVLQGQLDTARPLLDEALEMGVAAHSTRSVAVCLAAFARLAYADGDPARSALLAGAATGLRQRAGLRAWPTLRRTEDELAAQVRQALGAGRFDEAFAVGARLTQRDAVAAARDRQASAAM